MPLHNHSKRQQIRIRISQEAARLMVEHGIRDYHAAKQKAAMRLGVTDTRNLPRNDEIEAARLEHQRLFHSRRQPRRLHRMRRTALQAMRMLDPFQPRLVGPVLSGSAGIHDPVTLHLFSDTAEEVALLLMDREIPYQLHQYRLLLNGTRQLLPGYRFIADETEIELVVFPAKGLHHSPTDPADGRPMRRATTRQLERMLDQSTPHTPLGEGRPE